MKKSIIIILAIIWLFQLQINGQNKTIKLFNGKNLTDNSGKPLGEWNTMIIECSGREIKVWVNDELVLTFQKPQIDASFISKQNNGKDWDDMGVTDKQIWISKAGTTIKEGYIALQAESHAKARNYKPYFIKADNSTCKYK